MDLDTPWYERLAAVSNQRRTGGEIPLGMRIWLRQEKRKQRHGLLSAERSERLVVDAQVQWLPPIGAFEREWREECKGVIADEAAGMPLTIYQRGWKRAQGILLRDTMAAHQQLLPDQKALLFAAGITASAPVVPGDDNDEWMGAHSPLFEELVVFRSRHSHMHMTKVENPALYTWIANMRQLYADGKLSAARVALLEEIGFQWNRRVARAEAYIADLRRHDRIFNSFDVADTWAVNPQLRGWLDRATKDYRQGKLEEETIGMLRAIGYPLPPFSSTYDVAWNTMYQRLVAHLKHTATHPTLPAANTTPMDTTDAPTDTSNVATSTTTTTTTTATATTTTPATTTTNATADGVPPVMDEDLALWCEKQRSNFWAGLLVDEQIRLLREIRFDYGEFPLQRLSREAQQLEQPTSAAAQEWERNFALLKSHIERYGTCRVPLTPRYATLAEWCDTQRDMYRFKVLPTTHESRLAAVMFPWSSTPKASGALLGKDDAWECHFSSLQMFVLKHGHADVTRTPPGATADANLVRWMARCRRDLREGRAVYQRAVRLDALGVVWAEEGAQPVDAALAMHNLSTSAFTPSAAGVTPPSSSTLRRTHSGRRVAAAAASLSAAQCVKDADGDESDRSEPVDHDWSGIVPATPPTFTTATTTATAITTTPATATTSAAPTPSTPAAERREAEWQNFFQELVVFRASHGHCHVPRDYATDSQLCTWILRQRDAYRKGRLDPSHLVQLQSIDFIFHTMPREERLFIERLDDLKAFRAAHGHCNVPENYENDRLARWVTRLRVEYRRRKLLKQHYDRAVAVGLQFPAAGGTLDGPLLADMSVPATETFAAGASSTTTTSAAASPSAASVTAVATPTVSQISHVDVTIDWTERMAELLEFKMANGHCKVPKKYQPRPYLGRWVAQLRTDYWSGSLSDEHATELNKLDFSWDQGAGSSTLATHGHWEERFAELQNIIANHGGTMPGKIEGNQRLGTWCKQQRAMHRKGKLAQDRVDRLQDIGFDLVREAAGPGPAWEQQLKALAAYKETHGNCNVPRRYTLDSSLAAWVDRQRRLYRKGKLEDNRFQQLDALGFTWSFKVDPSSRPAKIVTNEHGEILDDSDLLMHSDDEQ